MLKDVIEVLRLKDKVRDEICLAMRRRVELFKELLTSDKYSNHPEFEYIKDQHYGCKDDIYYYYILPEVVQFIYQNSLYRAKWIFFNDKFKCWFVYDENKNEYVTFEALDTDTQIEIYRMLEEFLDFKDWSRY